MELTENKKKSRELFKKYNPNKHNMFIVTKQEKSVDMEIKIFPIILQDYFNTYRK